MRSLKDVNIDEVLATTPKDVQREIALAQAETEKEVDNVKYSLKGIDIDAKLGSPNSLKDIDIDALLEARKSADDSIKDLSYREVDDKDVPKIARGTITKRQAEAAPMGEILKEKKRQLLIDSLNETAMALNYIPRPGGESFLKTEEQKKSKALSLSSINIEDKLGQSKPLMDELRSDTKRGPTLDALALISIDEAIITRKIRDFTGLPKKNKLIDENYTDLISDAFGLNPENQTVKSIGLALSVFGSPSTYLTLGETAVGKLTAKGLKSYKAEVIARTEAITSGRSLTRQAKNELIEKIEKEVYDDMLSIKEATKGKAVSLPEDQFLTGVKVENQKAKALRGALFDAGGIKFAGRNIVTGEEVFKATQKMKLPQIWEAVAKAPPIDYVLKEKDKILQHFITDKPSTKAAEEIFSKIAENRYKVKSAYKSFYQENQNLFRNQLGLNDKDLLELGEAMKQANLAEIDALSNPIALGKTSPIDFIRSAVEKNPKLSKAVDAWKEKVSKIAKDAQVPESEIFEFYYPGIIRSEKRGMFSSRSYFDPKLPALFDPGEKHIMVGGKKLASIRPAEREFLIGKSTRGEDYIKDPLMALAARQTTILAANLQDEMLEALAVKHGKNVGDLIKEYGSVTKAYDDGWVRLIPHKEMINRELLGKVGSKLDSLHNTYVKADIFQSLKKASSLETTANIPFISELTNVWKKGVTVFFPEFHSRNFQSNVVFNAGSIGWGVVDQKLYREAMDLINARSGKGQNLRKTIKTDTGKEFTIEELLKEAEELEVMSGYWIDDLGAKLEKNPDKFERATWYNLIQKTNPLSSESIFNKSAVNMGQYVENIARLTNYLYWRKKGLSKELASKEAIRTLFDYGDITDTEKLIKQALPFYTFDRKNIQRQMELVLHKPGFVASQLKFFRDFGPSDDDWEAISDFDRDKLMIKWGPTIWRQGAFPIQSLFEIAHDPDGALRQRLSPYLKYAANWAFDSKTDLSTGIPFTSYTKADEFKFLIDSTGSKIPVVRNTAQFLVDKLKLEYDNNGSLVMDPDWKFFLSTLPTSRLQSTLANMNKDDKEALHIVFQMMTGLSVVSHDRDIRIKAVNQKMNSVIGDNLKRRRIVYEFKTYVPRPDKFSKNERKKIGKRLVKLGDAAKNSSELLSVDDMMDHYISTVEAAGKEVFEDDVKEIRKMLIEIRGGE